MKQKILDQYHHLTRGMLVVQFKNGHSLRVLQSDLNIKSHCTSRSLDVPANFVKIYPAVFEIPRAEDFFTKI